MTYHKVGSPSPTQPRKDQGNGHKVSQRGLLSIAMLLICMGGFGSAALGGTKLVFDTLGDKPAPPGLIAQIIVIGLAYVVGWVTALVAIRVFGNLVLPIFINWFTWACLGAICFLYIAIMLRMYSQPDDLMKFFKYMVVMAAGLMALTGFHLIIEDHDLRPFSIPLLIISLIQLGVIVFRYVFDTNNVDPGFLWKDLVFFFSMITVSVAMLAHWGILEPFRNWLTNNFDKNSKSIRTQD